jgi:P-type E1-E2 ATPase
VYRSSPDEKAKVVKYIMSNFDVFTLAIGDGANDVNML